MLQQAGSGFSKPTGAVAPYQSEGHEAVLCSGAQRRARSGSAERLLYHWLFDAPRAWPLLAQAPFTPGTSRVSVFFALTGFVIVLSYAEQIRTRAFSYARYLARRMARIYPLYFFVLSFLVMALGRPVSVVPTTALGIAANYGMAQALFSDLALTGI